MPHGRETLPEPEFGSKGGAGQVTPAHRQGEGVKDRQSSVDAAGEFGPDEPGFVDRRRRPTPMLSWYTFFGGRRGQAGDSEEYVDLYEFRDVLLILLFFSLTVFDALATVYYIDHCNGTEANPIAQKLLDLGSLAFVFAKGLPTGLLLLFVMIHKNFRYGKFAIYVGFGFYFLLSLYHLFLQLWVLSRVLRGMPLS
jgi:hypothetical protein